MCSLVWGLEEVGGGQHFCRYAECRRCVGWNGGWRVGGYSEGTLRADVVFVGTGVGGIFIDRETDTEEMLRGTLRDENIKF